ncbi:PIN domain-containing protein [Candidatus Microgenomates bacterium]|nr:PIN domain-containing protein [Candidatus Microgenomates bacterium]
MTLVFLDTNILLRHLLQDHIEHSPKATGYLTKIERGEARVRISEIVIFETVFTLERTYKQPKAKIRDILLPLIQLPGIKLPNKRRFKEIFKLYVELNLPFADAYHAVLMKKLKLITIATFDKDFDRISGIKRLELSKF